MLYAGLSTGVRIGANLILLPILVKKLTSAELATWWVFVALGGVANLADFGFGQAISRVYSYLWAGLDDVDTEGLGELPKGAEPNRRGVMRFNASVRKLYKWLSGGAILVLGAGGTLFLLFSSNSRPENPAAWWAWALFVVSVVYNFGTSHWTLACQGIDRVRNLQIANMWSGIAYVVVAGSLLLVGGGLWAMVFGFAARGLLNRQICCRAYRDAVPHSRTEREHADFGMLKRVWPNAWKFGLLSVAVYMINSVPILICSHYLSEAVTASYGLTCQLGMFLVTFSSLWLMVKWPQITILRAQGNLEAMSVLFARRLALVLASFGILAALLVLTGNRFLEWKGTETRLLAWPYLVVYLLYLWQSLFHGSFGNLTFTENVVPFYRLGICTGTGVIVLSILLTSQYGLWGLILAPLLAVQFANSWYPVWRGYRGQPLTVSQLLRAAVLGHK